MQTVRLSRVTSSAVSTYISLFTLCAIKHLEAGCSNDYKLSFTPRLEGIQDVALRSLVNSFVECPSTLVHFTI